MAHVFTSKTPSETREGLTYRRSSLVFAKTDTSGVVSYDYYPVMVEKRDNRYYILKLEFIGDGYLCFDRKIFRITKTDFIKGYINVDAETLRPGSDQPVQPAQTQSQLASPTLRDEDDEAADVAFQNQVEALLHI